MQRFANAPRVLGLTLPLPLALALALAATARADVQVTTLAGETLRGLSIEGRGTDHLALTTAEGHVRKIPTRQAVEVLTLPPPPAGKEPPPFEVELTDGSRLRGRLEGGENGALLVHSAMLPQSGARMGSVLLKDEQIRGLRRLSAAKMPARSRLVRIPGKDAAYTLEGARVEGFVESFGRDGVVLDRGALPGRTIAFDKLAALFVDQEAMPPPQGLHVVARLADGSAIVLGRDFKVQESVLTGTSPAGLELSLSMKRVAALSFAGGSFAHLSDLPPARIERTPFFPPLKEEAGTLYLDFVMPVHFDKSPDGNPIRLGGQRLFKGIGVRPRTELVYDLGAGFKEFRAPCGIDDEVRDPGYGHGSGEGSVIFTVLVDGVKKYESSPVVGGRDAVRVRVPVEGAKQLSLIVDIVPPDKMPGGVKDSPELDNAVWGRPLLVR